MAKYAHGEHDSSELLAPEDLQCAIVSVNGFTLHVSSSRPAGRLIFQPHLTPAWVLSIQNTLLTPPSKQITFVIVTSDDACKKNDQDHMSKLTTLLNTHTTWAARYNTWLLFNSTPKGEVFSFLFYTAESMAHQRSDAVSASGVGMPNALEKTQDDLTSCP